jgi:hypothetical protein
MNKLLDSVAKPETALRRVVLQVGLSPSGRVECDLKTAGIVPRAAFRRRDHPAVRSLVPAILAVLS